MKIFFRLVVSMCFLVIGFVSCAEKIRLRDTLMNFMKSEIIIPNDLKCIYDGEINSIKEDTLKRLKLIVYYDSLSCTSCALSNLYNLYPLYNMADTSNFSVITIFSPSKLDMENLQLHFLKSDYPIPIYLDVNQSFSNKNTSIPNDPRSHTFLISGDNFPIYIGNPRLSFKLKNIFVEVLNKYTTIIN